MATNAPPEGLPRQQLLALRLPLIELHRVLLEDERRRYEAANGRVSAAELLQLALQHQQFAWLHQISTVIVRVDALIAGDDPPDQGEVAVLAAHIRSLLKPSPDGSSFEQRYDRAVQDDPAVLLAHRQVIRALPPETPSTPPTVH